MFKKITAAIAAAALVCTSSVFAHPFSDVTGHWAEDEIDKAYSSSIVNGDDDGRFRPDDGISRAEFVKLLTALTAGKFDTEIPDELSDGSHWASKYYNFASMLMFAPLKDDKIGEITPGLLNADTADKPISRWEMAYMLAQTFANVFGKAGDDGKYTDSAEVAANYPKAVSDSITSCVSLGLIKGDESGKFNPADGGTRAEAVALINRSSKLMDELIEYYKSLPDASETIKTFDEIPKGHPVVTVEMENGKSFKIELYPEYAPQTVASFVSLVKSGFYDGLTFHRIIDGFVAQGGDPNGDGTGGTDYTVTGEFSSNGFDKNTLKHERGTVSMARSVDPNSASSQFFICYAPATSLDGEYAAFGKVIEGMETVDEFTKAEMKENVMGEKATPVTPIKMKKVTVKDSK